MTTLDHARRRPASATAATFHRAAAAEWHRLWSVRTTWWLLLATALLMALVTSTFVYEVIAEEPVEEPVTVVGQLGMAMAEYGLLVIAMLAVTAEFSTGAMRTSLQWVPRRGVLLAARTAVTVSVATVVAVLLVVAADLALWAATRGVPAAPVLTAGELATSVAWVAGAVAGSTLLTVGLAFAVRHSAGTLTAVFLLLFVLPASLLDAGVPWLVELARALPGSAVVAILLEESGILSPGRSAVVLVAWSLGATGLGAWSFLRRDV